MILYCNEVSSEIAVTTAPLHDRLLGNWNYLFIMATTSVGQFLILPLTNCILHIASGSGLVSREKVQYGVARVLIMRREPSG